MILIGSSDIVNNLMIYIVMFFMRSRFSFWYYFYIRHTAGICLYHGDNHLFVFYSSQD